MNIQTNLKNIQTYKKYLLIEQTVRDFLKQKDYLQIDLPVLTPALIPESYLEIFKTEFNYFQKKIPLFLTPSPELLLKRLLVHNIGNCYYLGKCYRNAEPNSSLHLPEFTMLEYYKVHIDYLKFAEEVLELLQYIAIKLYGKPEIIYNGRKLSFTKWNKLTVAESFLKYAQITQEELENEKLFIERARQKGYTTQGFSYEDLFSQIIAQEIEPKLGVDGYPSLLYDYPAKMASLAKLKEGNKIAKRCEFYIDGKEIGGFCEELSDWKEQEKRFHDEIKRRSKLGLIEHTVDKGFIEELKYGLPDCTGAGIGFDRLAMVFTNIKAISDMKLITINLD